MNIYPIDSKQARGTRLKEAIGLTHLSLLSFTKKYQLSYSTTRHWLAGNQGLTEKGALKLIKVLHNEGVVCSIDWLLYGKGEAPKRIEIPLPFKGHEAPENAFLTIQNEINYFKSQHPEAAIYEINDDSMLPDYKQGDIVAGIWHYGNDINKLIGKHCIAELKGEGKICRNLVYSSIPNHYTLFALNPNTRLIRPHLYDQAVVACAPIIWIRRGKKW